MDRIEPRKNPQLKILMLNYEFPPVGGGGGIVTHQLGKRYAAMGHNVKLVTSRFRDLPPRENVDGIEVHRVPVLRKSPDYAKVHEMMTYVLSASFWVLKNVPRLKPDIVHVFFGIPSGPVAYVTKKLFDCPYVVFLGGRDVPRDNPDPPSYRYIYPLLKPAIRAIWRSAGAVVSCSRGLRDLALDTDPTVKVRVIPDGIDLSRFKVPSRDADPDPIKILSIGRLIPRKGFHHLISAMPLVREKARSKVILEIVGDGPMMPELKNLVNELGLDDIVSFSGSVPYERLHEKYESADLFVLCSSAEGMPLVVLEAMATGLPVVASRVQGIDELIVDGENGYLIDDPSNSDLLSDRIALLINDVSNMRQFGLASLDLVRRYDWWNIAGEYIELFRQVLSRC